ncbi:6,7-dimethyl-8-ribityllumazine synthase [Pseudobythopirellula maris]|uniref:6,7-dimethyl-8-ribityllumazine synthase n=1 Tax=Pseudobythopirellula maris TaxID=2527991 RepID=A0A5C5ZRT8_9BACT|nr:6,7-dimethyl-8-ribityllumazine synthase [Pseudobythopirellula maris]TWT89627.1 6,7-dimethyl-8-ribityllumazine synthase [Pseudobythopirellula maris]
MPNLIEPGEGAASARYAIVVSEWNKGVTAKLLDGAIETLTAAGVADESIDVVWVPGAWEIPVVAQKLADTCRYGAILTLGAVIKGETAHDHWINHGVTDSLMRIATEHCLPVMFGVLMCDSLEQALNRAGGSVGNKGSECAEAALKMVATLKALPTK